MTRPTIAKIEGPKSSIRRRIREGGSGGPLSGDKEGGAGGRVSADGDDSSPLSAEADSFRMSHGGGGRSSVIGRVQRWRHEKNPKLGDLGFEDRRRWAGGLGRRLKQIITEQVVGFPNTRVIFSLPLRERGYCRRLKQIITEQVVGFPNTRVIFSLPLRERGYLELVYGRCLVSVIRVRVAGGPDAPRGGLLSKQGRRV
jgi:hypothetical protein